MFVGKLIQVSARDIFFFLFSIDMSKWWTSDEPKDTGDCLYFNRDVFRIVQMQHLCNMRIYDKTMLSYELKY